MPENHISFAGPFLRYIGKWDVNCEMTTETTEYTESVSSFLCIQCVPWFGEKYALVGLTQKIMKEG
jgi:hypothetical protein